MNDFNSQAAKQFHLGIYLGHDAGVSVVDGLGQPVFIGEESKFCGYKRPVFHPTQSLEHVKALGITHFASINWAFMERSPDGCNWSDFFRYLEGIQPGVRAYLSTFCSWDAENYYDHHLSHASGAFLPSGFDRSIVLVVDGSGEDESLSAYLADRDTHPVFKKIMSLKTSTFSFGHAYAEATRSIGYVKGPPDNHTGKMMGLSSFGRPRHLATLRSTLHPHSGLFPKMLASESDWHVLLADMVGDNIMPLHDGFSSEQADLAASMQRFLEDELLAVVSRLAGQYPDYKTLCLSGGVAQNSLMTGRILAQRIFDDIFSSPIASDTGLAYGASAMGAYELSQPEVLQDFKWKTAYSGFAHDSIKTELASVTQSYDLPIKIDENAFDAEKIADMLIDNKIVVLYQGGQEVGPRALGHRSILSLPTADMRDKINNTIKFREPWRPFAPVLLEEALPELFNETRPEPFMSIIYDTPFRSQPEIPGVNHFDNTTRLQTVNAAQNPKLHAIISAVASKGQPPIILNTSYNIDGQTIVRTVWDAILTALVSGVDALVLEDDVITSTLDTRAPREWLSVMDRILEGLLRPVKKLNVVSLCDASQTAALEEQLHNQPSLRKRKTPITVNVISQDTFACSAPEETSDALTLIWVGDRQISETEEFVVAGKFRGGYGPGLFDTAPEILERLNASTAGELIVLMDDQGRYMPKEYYLNLMAHRVNPYEQGLSEDAKSIRRAFTEEIKSKDAEIDALKSTVELLRTNITNVLVERDAYKKAVEDMKP